MATSEVWFEDVEIGDEIGPQDRVVATADVNHFITLWQAGSGPSRFTDVDIAASEGMPGPIVPGAMNMALMSQVVTRWSPTASLKRLDVVFRQVVLHNRPLRLRGVVTDKAILDGEPRVECDLFMEDEEGTVLVMGRATVVLPARG